MMKLLLVVGFIVVVAGAPSKVMTTYDQKQTGDYNIQLHLKDFQIVALIGDDTLGAFGDYEYNYDYSDLTIKPHNSSTTARPAELSSSSPLPLSTTVTTELPAKFSSTPVPSTTTQKLPETSSYASSSLPTTAEEAASNSSKTVRSDNSVIGVAPSSTTEKTQKVTSVTIVPQETPAESNNNNSVSNILNLGEILHYRKCPSGYSKDKRGRCRRTRRPGVIPYGITRLASNLAAKFRHAVSDENDAEEETSEE